MAYLELNDVSYVYANGFKAVDNVSLSIDRGECVAIVGENGAGKTTTAKLMNGLRKPTSGNVIVGGWNTKDFTTAKISRKVGYVFQNPDDQMFHNTVYSEIEFGPRNIGLSEEEIKNNVKIAAELTNITGFLEENPYDIPLSIQKFVCIASVLAMNTDVVVLDEPTAGQSKEGLDQLSLIISELAKRNKAVVTITHDMEFVVRNFDRIVVMAQSHKIADGSPSDIFYDQQLLAQAGLKTPHIARLAIELGIEQRVLDVEDFMQYLTTSSKKQSANKGTIFYD